MPQIISGKFFGDGAINEQQLDAILYSNYSWIAPISTKVIDIHPVDPYTSRVAAYTLRCKSRYESEPEPPEAAPRRQATLAHPHATPAIHQFRILCCFYFQAFFHEDRHYVETLCRPQARHSEDSIVPSRLVRRYFDLNVNGTNAEATDFPAFVDQAIGVPRAKFKLFISCVETFFDALESIGTNFDLAYSMFVYLLETLSKDGDTFTPQWSDYNRRTGDNLDAVFGRLDPADASEIKTILLDDSQLKLTQRFVDGISTLIEDSFFLAESEGRTNVVPRSQLREMLRNAYKTRSGYVHELRAVHQSLRDAGFNNGGLSDVFVWDNEPFLTLSGLIRLTHHVLRTYLRRQTQSSKEDYPGWRHELPGRITVKMAPQYWIWRHEGLSGENANSRFNGIVVHFCGAFQNAGSAITDLRNLITKIEEILGQTKPEHRHSLLGIYVLWNTVIVESAKSQQRDSVYARYSDQLSECTIQTFAVSVMLSETPVNWDGQDCARCLDDYERHRFKSGRVSLPRQLEIALAVETANRFCDAGDSDNFRKWMRHAMMDAGGLKEVQSEIQGAMDSVQRISTRSIMGFAVPQPDPPID